MNKLKFFVAFLINSSILCMLAVHIPRCHANDFPTMSNDASSCGYLPLNSDNFTLGNFENFAPVYAGTSSSWKTSNFSISQTHNMSPYCLQWDANNTASKWLIISNAFYLAKPYTVSVDVQITQEFFTGSATMEAGLIGAIQTYSRSPQFSSTLDALRLQRKYDQGKAIYTVLLSTNSNSSNWSAGQTVQT